MQDTFLYGTNGDRLYITYRNRYGRRRSYTTRFEGIVNNLERRYRETDSEYVAREDRGVHVGAAVPRLRAARGCGPESLAVRVGGLGIHELTRMSARRAIEWFEALELSDTERQIARLILREIDERLRFLDNVGVGYLSLDRAAATLSGGEAQRIRLATQIGSCLVGVLYILDEPSIGLHQRDNERLIATLERLRDLGNTVIVVEHDEGTMRAADHVVDIGPGAGEHGGRVVAEGTPEEVMAVEESVTGQFLAGTRDDRGAEEAAAGRAGYIEIEGAAQHNLEEGRRRRSRSATFSAVTGVSGSGKSTLVNEVLYKAVANRLHRAKLRPGAHRRDRRARRRSTRSSTSTSRRSGARRGRTRPPTRACSTTIRELFSKTQESRARGYKPGRFSLQRQGRPLRGLPRRRPDQDRDALPARRLRAVRAVRRQALQPRDARGAASRARRSPTCSTMPVEEAVDFFQHIPKIKRRLQALHDVGLDYIRLGQPATTLSGGEAQRVKLATRAGEGRDRADALHPRRADHRPPLRRRRAAARDAPAGSSTRATPSS